MAIIARSQFDGLIVESGINFKNSKSRTKQSEKDSCDINKILEKYKKTGILQAKIQKNPIYGDFSKVTDYQTSLNTVQKANEQFMMLHASIRERFNNDPAKMLAFCEDPKNAEEMIKLGLAVKPKGETTPTPIEPGKTAENSQPKVEEKPKT